MKVTLDQLEKPVLEDPDRLVADLLGHLETFHPHVVKAHPRGYLMMILHDSVRIARSFDINDVFNIRIFVDLRWRVAAGWFKEPRLAQILSNQTLSADQKFEIMTKDHMEAAWETAVLDHDTAEDWRGHLWARDV